ncbi:chromosome partitioning protein [Hamadaea sp. NPDC051192]|uniref:MinD/ParA family ATP-binding protein n=1 Tax=Hamadaea sp. NPDC051192 TaxID=3154940 RepID=UPI0034352BAA
MIYAPPDATVARAGVPVALPQRPKPNLPTQYVPPMPQDLPQAPESAWAQPPSSQYPMVGQGGAADVDALPRRQIQPLHGVPHQVPPAPMPRPAEPVQPPPVFLPPTPPASTPPAQGSPSSVSPSAGPPVPDSPMSASSASASSASASAGFASSASAPSPLVEPGWVEPTFAAEPEPGSAEPPAYWPQPPAEEPVYHYDADLAPSYEPSYEPSYASPYEPSYEPYDTSPESYDASADRLPDYLPDRLPNRSPDRLPDHSSDRLPDRSSSRSLDRFPDPSLDRSSEQDSGWTADNPPQEPYQLGPHQQPGPAVRPITAEEFSRRRAERRPEPQAERGLRGALRKSTFGLISPPPGRREQEYLADVDFVRRNFGGLRQITVVNPKGGAGKTVAVLMLAMTFGQRRGGYVLAWDNNETQGTLGMRAQQDFHSRTVRDLLRDLHLFQGAQGRVGDLSHYVRGQGEGMFEVLASDESATAGEMLTELAFGDIRDVVSRFYKIIVVDTGNNVRAPNWQAAVDATDQLVVTMSARNDSAETAARMLDHLEQTGRVRAVRQAVTVISMPQSLRELDVPSIERHFASRTRAVLRVPYERIVDTGEPIAYTHLSTTTTDAWLKVAAAVAAGL